MTRAMLEARLAKAVEMFLELDDWLADVSDDEWTADQEAKEHCLQVHSGLAKLYTALSRRLRKAGGK